MPEPGPLGLARLVAIVRAMVAASLVNKPLGGCVESLVIVRDHRRVALRFFVAEALVFLPAARLLLLRAFRFLPADGAPSFFVPFLRPAAFLAICLDYYRRDCFDNLSRNRCQWVALRGRERLSDLTSGRQLIPSPGAESASPGCGGVMGVGTF